jgi:hypothetical protein
MSEIRPITNGSALLSGNDEPAEDETEVEEAKELLTNFVQFLKKNTDTFDPVMVKLVIDSGDPLMPDDMAEDLINMFLGIESEEDED